MSDLNENPPPGVAATIEEWRSQCRFWGHQSIRCKLHFDRSLTDMGTRVTADGQTPAQCFHAVCAQHVDARIVDGVGRITWQTCGTHAVMYEDGTLEHRITGEDGA